MIIKALSFVPVLTQPGHARRDGVGAEKEEEKKKTGSEVGEGNDRENSHFGTSSMRECFLSRLWSWELCFWKIGCGINEEEGPVGAYP